MRIRIYNFNEYYNVTLNIPNDSYVHKFLGISKVIDKTFFIELTDFTYLNYVITANIKCDELTKEEFNSIVDYLKIVPSFWESGGFKTNNEDGTISVDISKFNIWYEYRDILKLRSEKLQKIIEKNLAKKLQKENETKEITGNC